MLAWEIAGRNPEVVGGQHHHSFTPLFHWFLPHFLSTSVPENSCLLLPGSPMGSHCSWAGRSCLLRSPLPWSLPRSHTAQLPGLTKAHLIQTMRGLLHPQLTPVPGWVLWSFSWRRERGGWKWLFLPARTASWLVRQDCVPDNEFSL